MKQNIKLDKHTFGGTRASERLSEILLKDYPGCISKVSKFYHKFTTHITSCVYATHHFLDGGMKTMLYLYRDHVFKKVNDSNLPDVVKSHLLNVMSYSFRQKMIVVNLIIKHRDNNSKRQEGTM